MSNPPSALQAEYVRGLQRRLKLSHALLDSHCVAKFGCHFRELDKRQCSALIDEMVKWKAIPVELQREAGQIDLFMTG